MTITLEHPVTTTVADAAPLIAARRPFVAGGRAYGVANFRGTAEAHTVGRLTPEWAAAFDAAEIDYVVYSYLTPIAWFTSAGEWVRPPLKYTVSTTAHQRSLHLISTH